MTNLSGMMSSLVSTAPLSSNHNPMKDFEVVHSPDDAVTCMAFSPPSMTQANYLIAGSWDNNVRCWEIQSTCNSIPKQQQSMTASVLDVAWSADGSKVFMAGCDKLAKCWDLPSNQCIQVATHDASIKTCHWIKYSNYNCLMTGSLDKTVKFWDLRAQQPIVTLQLPEQVHCADVDGSIAVVSTAGRQTTGLLLETNPPQMTKISLQNPTELEHRCISIFHNKKGETDGFAVGSFGGQVSFHKFRTARPKTDNFEINCHNSTSVNDIKFHPKHGTMATAGSDGAFTFWDKDKRSKMKTSFQMQQPVTSCSFSHDGQIFAYSVGYDWSKGDAVGLNSEQKKSHIFLRPCMEETKPRH